MLDIWDLELKIIARAESWTQLRNAFSSLLKEIEKQGLEADPYDQVGAISAAYREATRRACELLIATEFAQRVRPEDFAFLSLGGEGRREVTLKFDQDNAIVFARRDEALVSFAEQVVERLAWLGFDLCPGGVMASQQQWQGTVDEWVRRVRLYCGDGATPDNVRAMTALFDVDFVAGNAHLFETVVGVMREEFPRSARAQRVMAADILDIPRYIGLTGRLLVESRRDRRGLFNFKFACLYPFVGYLRIEAWRHGVTTASTKVRVAQLRNLGQLDDSEADQHTDTFRKILGLRLAQQRRQRAAGRPLSDYFDLSLHSAEELAHLKHCVRYVERLKKRLRWLYWV